MATEQEIMQAAEELVIIPEGEAEPEVEEAPEGEAEPEVEEAPEGEAEAKTEETEETPENLKKELDGRFAALRRMDSELKSKTKSLEEKFAKLEEKEKSHDALAELMREDPEKAWELFAKKAGMESDDFLGRVVDRRVKGEPGTKELAEEIRALKAEREAEREAAKQREQQQAQEQQQAVAQRAVARATQDWMGALSAEEAAKEYPGLTALAEPARAARLESAMWWATQNPQVPLADIVKAIDKMVQEEYPLAVQGRSTPGSPAKTPAGKQPTSTEEELNLSNQDQASHSGAGRLLTKDERLRAAAAALRIV